MAEGYVIVLDIDNQCGEFTLCDYDEWHETGLGRAALAYAQCCGWDVSPGEAGIWVCYYVPNESWGGGERYNGNLVGFAVLYDGDEDGQYETLSHIWTAAAARRRGVARALIAHARQHFPLKHIAGPATDGGTALLKAVWPEAISERA